MVVGNFVGVTERAVVVGTTLAVSSPPLDCYCCTFHGTFTFSTCSHKHRSCITQFCKTGLMSGICDM